MHHSLVPASRLCTLGRVSPYLIVPRPSPPHRLSHRSPVPSRLDFPLFLTRPRPPRSHPFQLCTFRITQASSADATSARRLEKPVDRPRAHRARPLASRDLVWALPCSERLLPYIDYTFPFSSPRSPFLISLPVIRSLHSPISPFYLVVSYFRSSPRSPSASRPPSRVQASIL